jgi:hypothetical protein
MNAAIKTTELSGYVNISCGIRGDHRDEGYVVTSICHHIILTGTKKMATPTNNRIQHCPITINKPPSLLHHLTHRKRLESFNKKHF